MKTPFTAEQFMDIFRDYNTAVFPLQIVFYFLAVVILFWMARTSRLSGPIVSGILLFFWAWMAVAYHLIFFTRINKAAWLFGSLFLVQAALFWLYGIYRRELRFRIRADFYGITGLAIIAFALLAYPGLAYLLGQTFPAVPGFGLPCPTTIFTFGVLLLNERKCPPALLVIPLLWSILAMSAALNFGILQDLSLPVVAIGCTTALLLRNRVVAAGYPGPVARSGLMKSPDKS